MPHTQFALSWEAHKKNICNGLSSLQQNGEFVDMTLAADGHMVKVHQVIMALASPYIKDLIASAQCRHPIIFLNRISYSTLCFMLEYIYTGEVMVNSENLNHLIEAGRELHIKGLEDMKMSHSPPSDPQAPVHYESTAQTQDEDDEVCFFEIPEKNEKYQIYTRKNTDYGEKESILGSTIENVRQVDESFMESLPDEDMEGHVLSSPVTRRRLTDSTDSKNSSVIQYTVSNQGSLQMILNRYIYYLKHSNRNNSRQWRCVDYVTSIKCPAHVVTKDDVVVQRIAAHIHPFHDKRIMKKIQAGAIFLAIHDAEKQGNALSTKKGKLAHAAQDDN